MKRDEVVQFSCDERNIINFEKEAMLEDEQLAKFSIPFNFSFTSDTFFSPSCSTAVTKLNSGWSRTYTCESSQFSLSMSIFSDP